MCSLLWTSSTCDSEYLQLRLGDEHVESLLLAAVHDVGALVGKRVVNATCYVAREFVARRVVVRRTCRPVRHCPNSLG